MAYSVFNRRKAKQATERARQRANRRWALDRAKREAQARATVEKAPAQVRARVLLVVEPSADVVEFPIWSWNNAKDVRRLVKTLEQKLIMAVAQD